MDKMNSDGLSEIKEELDQVTFADCNTVLEAEINADRFATLLEKLVVLITRAVQNSPCDKNINDAIILLAENSGSGVDIKKHENFISELRQRGLITDEQESIFYEFENRRQG